MVTVENDTWAACVVIPDRVIKVAVGFIAETEVGLWREVREEVLEGQTDTEIPSLNISIFLSCQN